MLITGEGPRRIEPRVYIHVKGYSRARTTHLDIESEELNDVFPPGVSFYARTRGVVGGFILDFSRYMRGVMLEVSSETLSRLFKPGEASIAYVGGKQGGVFLGFKKEYVRRLEEIARLIEPSLFDK